MKIKVNKDKVENYKNFLRRLGYALIQDRRQGTESFVRRLGEGHYPRIHLYVDDLGDFLSFNLHLDQKKVSYSGFNRHNAEYDNNIIEEEISRIKNALDLPISNQVNFDNKNIFQKNNFINKASSTGDQEILNNINSGNIEQDARDFLANKKKKKRFWIF